MIVVVSLGLVTGIYLIHPFTRTVSTTSISTVTTTEVIVLVSSVPAAPTQVGTITEEEIVQYYVNYTVYAFGVCTNGALSQIQTPSTSTTYIFPQNVHQYMNLTMSTVNTGGGSVETVTFCVSSWETARSLTEP